LARHDGQAAAATTIPTDARSFGLWQAPTETVTVYLSSVIKTRTHMLTTQTLADHLRSVYLDGGWSDVSVRGAFRALSHDQASARSIPNRHTAWEILLHVDAWHRAVARRLAGDEVSLGDDEDWPVPPANRPENWTAALDKLDEGFEVFVEAVRAFPSERLLELLSGSRSSAFRTIVGIGEHDLYHAGQVVFLNC
jgi:uncharacterized damage-inducible protein DinB